MTSENLLNLGTPGPLWSSTITPDHVKVRGAEKLTRGPRSHRQGQKQLTAPKGPPAASETTTNQLSLIPKGPL